MIIHHRRHLLRPQHVFEMANIFKYFEMCAYLVLTMGVWFGLTAYQHSLGHTTQNIYDFGQLRNVIKCVILFGFIDRENGPKTSFISEYFTKILFLWQQNR